MDATHDADRLHVSRTDHGEGWTVAADLRPVDDEYVSVEILGDTALVAIDAPLYRTEVDISLPDEGGSASLQNGVLVVEPGQ